MTFIPFKQDGNRLYIDLKLYQQHAELREFINKLNASMRPMPFNIDYTARKVWFYPPENYVMPTLTPKTQQKAPATDLAMGAEAI